MIVRAPRPEGNFYILDKRISEDRRLSWAARGLLVYLLGKPDYWQVSPAALVAETAGSAKATGRDGIYSLLNELIEAGYMTRQQARSADGSMGPIRYTVSEQPHEESPVPGEPHPAEPYPVEPTQVSIDTKQGLTKKQGLNSGAAQQVAFDGQRISVSDEAMAGFLRAYPSIDVRAEIAKAEVWCQTNPARRPRSAYSRFLNAWLARAASRPTNARQTQLEQRQAFMASIFRNHNAIGAFDDDPRTIDHRP